ncbi:ALP1-like protein [Tanacetum coccineum]
MCLNPWGRSSYARALIEMTSDRAFVESLVVGIPLEDGLRHSMETIEVEYEWKPPHCGVCKTFGHTLSTCPKGTTETTNSGNKNTTKSDSKSVNTADEEGFVEVSNRKKKGKNHGKSTRIDGIKFTKPKASFYQEKKGPKSTANQSKASTSSSIPGKNSTSVSNFFDTLCNLEEEGVNDPKGKNEETSQSRFFETSKGPSDTYDSPNVNMAGGTRVSKATKVPSTPFPKSARPECINEYDTNEDDIESSNAPEIPFVANGVNYPSGYYLVDGIYPELAPLVKTIPEPADDDHKRILYKQKQESARKDVERAFGVLKKKWAILANPARALRKDRIVSMMYTCIILHNMIRKYKNYAISPRWFPEEAHQPDDPLRNEEQVQRVMRWIKSSQAHQNLRHDLIEHLAQNA